ncbi:aspartate/glutamate racemase family protein [Pararobbsia silviterrae]|uniref:Aspartate/glutamate racemase family protein n=1 Tax=Pararobbsia silviterrae TaxID=1792498 RepID=A0A494XMS1_9BURK|nr:aspartate/glutamate racemase family protein [Pararobbsia silviterrae]RKP51918.1 aspartate/glutamate racemase family protein [Pararobbsia silviterrae]
MRTIGLIGGMSWESTAVYYRLLNHEVRDRLGGLSSAQLLLYSVDFAPIATFQREGHWHQAGAQLAAVARKLEAGGAECILLCTNTMHLVAQSIVDAISVPFLHIVDPVGEAVRAAGLHKVGFIGTAFSMRERFFADRLHERHGVSMIVPPPDDQAGVHEIIYNELCLGKISETSRAKYREIMHALAQEGAEAIVLGCTEITLLVSAQDSPVPLLDTTTLHAKAAVDFSLDTPSID